MYSLCPRIISLQSDAPETRKLSECVAKIIETLETQFNFKFPFVSLVKEASFKPFKLDKYTEIFENLAVEYSNLQNSNPGHFLVIAFRLTKDGQPHTVLFLPHRYRHFRSISQQLLHVEGGPAGNSEKTIALFRKYYDAMVEFSRVTRLEPSSRADLRDHARFWLREAFYGSLQYVQNAFCSGLNRMWEHEFEAIPRSPFFLDEHRNISYFPMLHPLLELFFAKTPDDMLARVSKIGKKSSSLFDCARYAMMRVAVRDEVLRAIILRVYMMLFMASFEMNDPNREQLFASIIPSTMKVDSISISELDEMHRDFILSHFEKRYKRAVKPTRVWRVPWTQASTLVKSRSVILIKGWAYISYMDAYTAFFYDAFKSAVEQIQFTDYNRFVKPMVEEHVKKRGISPLRAIPFPKDIKEYQARCITFAQAENRVKLMYNEYWDGFPTNYVTQVTYGFWLIDNTAKQWYESDLRANISRILKAESLSRTISGVAAGKFSSEKLQKIFENAFTYFCSHIDPVGKWKVRADNQKPGVIVLDRGAPSVCKICSTKLQKQHIHEMDNTAFLALSKDGEYVEWGCWRVGPLHRISFMKIKNE